MSQERSSINFDATDDSASVIETSLNASTMPDVHFVPETDSSGDDDDDDFNMNHVKRKKKIIYSDDDDDDDDGDEGDTDLLKSADNSAHDTDEEEQKTEARCFSPHTRRSLVGLPSYLQDSDSDSESNSDEDIERSEDDSIKIISTNQEHSDDATNQSTLSLKNYSMLLNSSSSIVELSDDNDSSKSSTSKALSLVPLEKLLKKKVEASTPKKTTRTQLEIKRDELINKIIATNSLASCGANLPDKGEKLKSYVKSLEEQLETINEQISSGAYHKTPAKSRDSWESIAAAADAVQPKYTGKVGLSTFNSNKALTIDRLQQMHNSLENCPKEDQLVTPPKSLKIALMNHQQYAISWMLWREKEKPRGGILADDMGLGKTLTIIALVALSMERQSENDEHSNSESDEEDAESVSAWKQPSKKSLYYGGTLVVCPASLINQWEKEVEHRLKRNTMSVCIHHGSKREVKPRHLSKFDIVVTTYAIVSREHKTRGALFCIKFDRIVLDEAHIIRNHKTKQSLACFDLKGSSKWALTGTPIQNKEADLFSLLKFLKCSPFDDYVVYKQWLGNQSAGAQQRLNSLVQPLLLRRTKLQLQTKGQLESLPEKIVEEVIVTLETDEMNVYQKIMTFSKTLFSQFLHQRAERQHFGYITYGHSNRMRPNEAFDEMHQRVQKMHGMSDIKSHQILLYILRLRQICCHPGLIDAMLEDENFDDEHNESLAHIDLLDQLNKLQIDDRNDSHNDTISKAASKVLLRSNPVYDLSKPSSKFKKILDLLEEKIVGKRDKAVIVSQWSTVLDVFSKFLDDRRIKYVKLTGSVPIHLRNDIVIDFNNENSSSKVILLSLTAGGVGLNLTGGNYLFIVDPHWNPQLEAQAQDRIYRMGQKKKVFIYKLLCHETIEERIKVLQERKLSIADDVLTGAKRTASSKLTIEDMKALFGMSGNQSGN